MKKEMRKLTDTEIWMCILFGRFKWYRRYKGGTWTLIEGFPYYWINREPYPIEEKYDEVYKIERYE